MGTKVMAVGAYTKRLGIEDVIQFQFITAKRRQELEDEFLPGWQDGVEHDDAARAAYSKAIDMEFQCNCWDMAEVGMELWMVRPERTQIVIQPEEE